MNPTITLRNVSGLFPANALIKWIGSLPSLINPAATADAFGVVEPNFPALIRLWQGVVFMFGGMFWEVSGDVRAKAALIKYNWIEITITATTVTSGDRWRDIAAGLMLPAIFTNCRWIPFIGWAQLALQRIDYWEARTT